MSNIRHSFIQSTNIRVYILCQVLIDQKDQAFNHQAIRPFTFLILVAAEAPQREHNIMGMTTSIQ